MTVIAISSPSSELAVGGAWVIAVSVTDADGDPAYTAPTVTVTLPNGTTAIPTVVDNDLGCYAATYFPATTGRYVARAVVTNYGAADFAAYVAAVVPEASMPTLVDVKAYLGPTSFGDAEITDALNAEAASQRRLCQIPADYPADLAQALKRRVARNLALRGLPLAVLRGDSEGGDSTVLPGRDPEVKRLEAGYRRVTVG